MIIRQYVVSAGRGRLSLEIAASVIEARGERTVVAERAWQKLMGLDQLGVIVDRRSTTRSMLQIEIGSNYVANRPKVYEKFRETISFKMVGIIHANPI